MKKSAFILFVALTVLSAPLFAQDPCSQSTQLNANASGTRSWNGTVSATTVGGSGDDAYGVEAWTEAGGSATKLTWYGPNQGGGYAFRAEWTNSTDYLGRFGYFWGTNGKKWNNLGDLCVDYNYTRSANGTGGSYSYIGIYGWTIGSNNSAEYYIVEDWYGNGQQGANNLGNNCQTHGNITVDGKTYQVVTCVRPQGSGCVSCNNQAFGQVFSIRQNMSSAPKCGTISIKKHFEEWIKMTTEKNSQSPAKYIYDKTYESKFLAEAQGGTGWFDATYMKFSRTGTCGGTPSSSSSSRPSSSSVAASSSSRPSSSSVAPSSSSRPSSSSVAPSSSSRPSSSSVAASSSSRISSSSRSRPSSSSVAASSSSRISSSSISSSSSSSPTPITVLSTIPSIEFGVRSLSNGTILIESNANTAIHLYNTKGNLVQEILVNAGSSMVKISIPAGIYVVKNAKTGQAQRVLVR